MILRVTLPAGHIEACSGSANARGEPCGARAAASGRPPSKCPGGCLGARAHIGVSCLLQLQSAHPGDAGERMGVVIRDVKPLQRIIRQR